MFRYAQQCQLSRGNLFSLLSPVRTLYPVTDNVMFVVFGLFMLNGIIQKRTARLYFQNAGFGKHQFSVVLLTEKVI
jgi:uncharacterized membrane protein YjgN (DUF898 family)